MAEAGERSLPALLLWPWFVAAFTTTVLVMCQRRNNKGTVTPTQKDAKSVSKSLEDHKSQQWLGSEDSSYTRHQNYYGLGTITFPADRNNRVEGKGVVSNKKEQQLSSKKEDTRTTSSCQEDDMPTGCFMNTQGVMVRPENDDETINMIRTNFGPECRPNTKNVTYKPKAAPSAKEQPSGGDANLSVGEPGIAMIPEKIEKKNKPDQDRDLEHDRRDRPDRYGNRDREGYRDRDSDRSRRKGRKNHGGKGSKKKKSRLSNKKKKKKRSKKSHYSDEDSEDEEEERRDRDRKDGRRSRHDRDDRKEDYEKKKYRDDKDRKRDSKKEKDKKEEKKEKFEVKKEEEKKEEKKDGNSEKKKIVKEDVQVDETQKD